MAKVTRTPGPGAKQLEIALKNLGDVDTKVGVVEAVKYEDGTPVAYVAAIQELGSPQQSIPPRPFFRPTAGQRQSNWRALAESGAKAVIAGTATNLQVMGILGDAAAGDIRKTISQIQNPPLSPVTLRLRKLKREGVKVGGKIVGEVHKAVNTVGPRPKHDKSADVSGVSDKPLVFDGILLNAITSTSEET
jgi:hypothetical protein